MEYSLAACPINVQKKVPGNIGEGISSDATVNIRKKTIRIIAPRIRIHLQRLFISEIALYKNI